MVPGDPTEELLYQSRAQQADLIVLGAQGASAFAAITRHGVVYKVLAHAHCPVITLSPVVLAECGSKSEKTAAGGSLHGRRLLGTYNFTGCDLCAREQRPPAAASWFACCRRH